MNTQSLANPVRRLDEVFPSARPRHVGQQVSRWEHPRLSGTDRRIPWANMLHSQRSKTKGALRTIFEPFASAEYSEDGSK
jgi:hypothetical protein